MKNTFKTLMFTIALLSSPLALSQDNKSKDEFDTKYEKSVDLEKVEKKIGGNDVDAVDLDESVQNNAKASQTDLDFNNMSVDANYKAPTGFLITGKKNQALQRMISIRKDFKSELKKSAEQLPALVK
jgi:hypothetical protein